MKPAPARLVRWLLAAVASMLVGLAGLGVFVHSAVGRIDEASSSIADDTAPSIVALEATSVALTRLHRSLARHLRAPDDPTASPAQIAAERRALAEKAAWYFALPIDPGEGELMDDLRFDLGRLDRVADRILAVGPGTAPRDRDGMKVDLDAAKGAIDGVIVKAFDLNAELAYAATGELRGVGRRLLPGLVVFMVVCGLAAMVALGVAYRVSRTEAALTERWLLTQKNAELEAFSARVAHDVLTPLTTASLGVGFAEGRLSTSGDEQVGAALSRAGRALQRVQEMVSDLLEFARAAAPPPTGATTEVAPYVEALVGDLQPIASEAHVDLALTSVSQRRVACAAGILSSLLSNLIQNAIRYTGKAAERHVEVRAIDAGPEVLFEVEDTGPGIPPEDRERIFEPFVRRATEGPGLGLGLATVKRLAESYGGHVGVRPAAGHGSLFWVTLPAAPARL
jgi:signal transduction histidine kinase